MESTNGKDNEASCAISVDSGIARLHSSAVPIVQPALNGKVINSNGSLTSISSHKFSVGSTSSGDTDIQYIKASELYPKKSPWVEDSADTSTPPFPLLPGEGIAFEGRTVEGTLYISNYRLYLYKTSNSEPAVNSLASNNSVKNINVPLGLIETVECKDIFYLNLYCKDARSFRLVFVNGESCQDWAKRLLQNLNLPRKAEDVFSLAFCAWAQDSEDGHPKLRSNSLPSPWWRKISDQNYPLTGEQLFRFEVERQGYDTSVTWRTSTANNDFKLSPSYPTHLLVPMSISDDKLEAVASFRSARRLPAVVWRNRRNGAVLGRCSQPEVGWLGWRSQEDENLLLSILDACFYDSARNAGQFREASPSAETSAEWNGDASSLASNGAIECGSLKDLSEDSSCFTQGKKKMLIVDARSYATAVANRARGGGCEFPQYYPQCDIEFMNLANIHAVRKSFLLLRALCLTAASNLSSTDQSNWFTQLDSTRWLHHLSNLLRASWYTAVNLEDHGRPVLVHCSDGWDRTPQIVSLAQLLIDPFYRTVKGFQILVQREWLEFGHKFADRCGLLGGCEDLNERCPVFLQFLDCVHQLMIQFPTAFQFNHAYLVKLVQHVYSNLFGTFLLNNVQERYLHHIPERSHSLWTFLLDKSDEYCNFLYQLSQELLRPSYQVRDLQFWSVVYLAELGSDISPKDECDGHLPAANPNTSNNSPCSSGYATPQQTALTDSMVDTLPWKSLNVKEDGRNIMEDSTDTLVDDGSKPFRNDSQLEGDFETGECFPLLEPEPRKDPVYCDTKNQQLHMPVYRSKTTQASSHPAADNPLLLAIRENGAIGDQNRFQSDCETCQQNWDLLNRNQPTSIDVKPRDNPPAEANPACLNFDLDGLLPSVDQQQVRLGQILAAKDVELEALRRDLHQTRVALCRQVCHSCQSTKRRDFCTPATNSEGVGRERLTAARGGERDGDERSSPSANFGSSWENVDEKEMDAKAGGGPPTLWVPDHAAPMCMRCSITFWMGRRKHHCRNCGQVICAECAEHELPLPHQSLFQPVRVCNICYDSLTQSSGLSGPEAAPGTDETDEFAGPSLMRSRAYSLSSLASGHCACHCCQIKRPTKFKTVTAASN